MKIILTGGTGFVGSGILQACINHIYIIHIYAIVRHPLPDHLRNSSKVTQIIHSPDHSSPSTSEESSFATWALNEITVLKANGVQGCIWSLGGPANKYSSSKAAHAANVEYPVSAIDAWLKAGLIPTPHAISPYDDKSSANVTRKPFRFVYVSCAGAEQDPSRSLWTNVATRRLKGAAEKALFDIADSEDAQGMVLVYALRPGKVLSGGQSVGNVLTEAVSCSTSIDKLAKCAIDVVLDGAESKVLENASILGDDWADINTIT